MLTIMPRPEGMKAFRPDWIALLLIFWSMQLPRTWSVGTAWIAGIVLDVSYGTLLGQHALALERSETAGWRQGSFDPGNAPALLMRVFPLSQLTATVFALLALYQFLLFWINGVVGVTASPTSYWGPVITGTILWPFLFMFLSGVRYHSRSGT